MFIKAEDGALYNLTHIVQIYYAEGEMEVKAALAAASTGKYRNVKLATALDKVDGDVIIEAIERRISKGDRVIAVTPLQSTFTDGRMQQT